MDAIVWAAAEGELLAGVANFLRRQCPAPPNRELLEGSIGTSRVVGVIGASDPTDC